ncbi:MAG TPA: DUF945 family protein [Thioalkalivibrio sp.]|nr:DUF945 family protein [Thioalkalivibrio sp.]
MRKILTALPLILVPLALWPIYVGVQVENAMQQPQSVQVGDLRIQHLPQHYERTHYRADAGSVLEIRDGAVDVRLQLEHRIRHRILGAELESRLVDVQVNEAAPPGLRAALIGAQPRAESWVGLGGGVNARFQTQPVRIQWPADASEMDPVRVLELADGRGGLAYTRERMVLSFDTPRVSISDGARVLEAGGAHYGLLVHPGPEGDYGMLPDYDLSLGAESVRLREGDAEQLSARSLWVVAWQNSAHERLDSVFRLRAEAIEVPPLSFQAFDTHVSALRLNRPALLALIANLEGLRLADVPPEARPGLAWGIGFETLKEMAEGDPALQAGLHLNPDSGKRLSVAADLALKADRQVLDTRPLEALVVNLDIDTGREVMAELEALLEASGVLDEAAGDTFAQWLEHAVSEGWIEQSGDGLRTHLRLEDGRLYINGEDRTLLWLATVFAIGGGMF